MALTIINNKTSVYFELGNSNILAIPKGKMIPSYTDGKILLEWEGIKIRIDELDDVNYPIEDINSTVGHSEPNDVKGLFDIIYGFFFENSSVDVNLQDQHTPMVVTKFTNLHTQTTTTASVAVDDNIVSLTSIGSAVVGDSIVLFDITSIRFSQFEIVAINSLDVTLDSLIDFAYPSGTFIDIGSHNLAVDGSITPVVFGLRNPPGTPPEGIELSFDVTKLIFTCQTSTAVDLAKFGNLTKLANGLMLRSKNGIYQNIFNVKSNQEIAGIFYDWIPYAATNPQQGQDGFIAEIQFAGQAEVGVVVRLPIGEDLQLIVQDNLSTLTNLEVIAEGHIVDP